MKKNLLTLDVALSKEIKYMLKEEHYLPGDKLPSERKLAELFHVQRLTVRGALDLLLQMCIRDSHKVMFPSNLLPHLLPQLHRPKILSKIPDLVEPVSYTHLVYPFCRWRSFRTLYSRGW